MSLSPDEFFPTPDPPLNNIDPDILNFPHTDHPLSKDARQFLAHLNLIFRETPEFSSQFTTSTLQHLEFGQCCTLVISDFTIPLTICNEEDHTVQTGLCLLHPEVLVLLALVENNTLTKGTWPEAQVVAGAIAAFQTNNERRKELKLKPLDAMTIPAITMTGSCPTFYLVPVMMELSDAVATGQYPTTQTQVSQCVTRSTKPLWSIRTGMDDKEYRQLALRCFLTFKSLVGTHWKNTLEGMYVGSVNMSRPQC